jgi:carboxyl-terminal processing protease
MRESDLRRHLSNPKEPEDADPVQEKVLERAVERGGVKGAEKVIANPAERKPIEFGSAEDFQLQQALNLLRGQPVQTLKKDEVAGAESTKVSTKASTKGTSPAN